jgi:dephospho-CoA kinase
MPEAPDHQLRPVRPFVLGLTGSIGMGKSTTAGFFREAGVPVHDADAAVHAIYVGEGVAAVGALFPEAVVDGVVDRKRLAARVLGDKGALASLEAAIHPLVRAREAAFLDDAASAGHPVVVLDIPLLFETGSESRCDAVLVVTAPAEVQRARVLARPGMTEPQFAAILARQTPDAEKRARADYLVDTSFGLDSARAAAMAILEEVRARARRQPQG